MLQMLSPSLNLPWSPLHPRVVLGCVCLFVSCLQVVVPVRETAAQALAAALHSTSLFSLQRVLELLACMHNHSEWHVRHGAYTGIKYLLASRWVC